MSKYRRPIDTTGPHVQFETFVGARFCVERFAEIGQKETHLNQENYHASIHDL